MKKCIFEKRKDLGNVVNKRSYSKLESYVIFRPHSFKTQHLLQSPSIP